MVDAAGATVAAAETGGGHADVDIDWNVVSVVDGGGVVEDISWDVDVGAGDADVVDYGFSAGVDDVGNNAFGISISTDGVDGQANVFEDPER